MRPQDVVVLLKLQAAPGPARVREVADSLGFDLAGTHRSIKRLTEAGLYVPDARGVPRAAAEEFLISAVRWFFPAVRGAQTHGVPTSWAMAPLDERVAPVGELPPVWPDLEGRVWGVALLPLHPIVPAAAGGDERLYRRLALLDAIRDRQNEHLRTTANRLLRAELQASRERAPDWLGGEQQ